MAKRLQLRRGTKAQHEVFTGSAGEITVVTDENRLAVHNGVTPGGEMVPTLTEHNKHKNDALMTAYGYTKNVKKADRFIENADGTVTDVTGDKVRFSDGLYEQSTESNFAALSNDYSATAVYVIDPTLFSVNDIVHVYAENIVDMITTVTEISDAFIRVADTYDRDIGVIYTVRKLQTLELPEAPFSPSSTDTLLDYSLHGVTTQIAHELGDIVHCGNGQELVTNGTFDTNTDGWTAEDSVTIDRGTFAGRDNVVKLTNNDTYANTFKQEILSKLAIGTMYKVECYAYSPSSNAKAKAAKLILGTESATITEDDKWEKITLTVLAVSGMYDSVGVRCEGTDGDATDDIVYFDNISVTPIEQTYQAIEPTTSGELLTSSKFQKLDSITRQDVITIAVENGKAVYKTMKGLHTFAPGTSNDEIASAYSWSKLGNGLYSVDGVESIIVGLSSRLNAGAYHPVFNSKACGKFRDSSSTWQTWYTTNEILATYDCVLNNGGAGEIASGLSYNGRPDGAFYDKLYFDSIGGLVFKPSYAITPSASDILTHGENELIGVDAMAESAGVECVEQYGIPTTIHYVLASSLFKINYKTSLTTDTTINANAVIQLSRNGVVERLKTKSVYKSSSDGTLIVVYDGADTYASGDTIEWLSITIPDNTTLTQGTNLTLDVIGNPSKYISTDTTGALQSDSTDTGTELRLNALSWNIADSKMYRYLDTDDRDNVDLTVEDYTDVAKWEYVIGRYPNSWYNRLDSGLSLPFNPLLVGQDGSDYIPDGVINPNIMMSNKVSWLPDNYVYTITSGDILNASTSWHNYFDYIANNRYDNNTFPSNFVGIVHYTSLNTPLVTSTSKPIELVGSKAIASNSHSWYRAGGVVNAITGKVSVGNGSKSLVAKGLEDAEITYDAIIYPNVLTDRIDGKKYKIKGFNKYDGMIFEKIGTAADGAYPTDYDFSVSWKLIGYTDSTPTHNQVNLDAEPSPTAKAFTSLAIDNNNEYLIQVNGQELIYDADALDYGDSGNDFTQLTNGTLTDDNGATVRTYTGFKRTGIFKGDN